MKEVPRTRSSALNLIRSRCGFLEGRWRVTALLPLPLPLGSALLVLRTRIMDALPVWRGRKEGEREESDDGRANERAGGRRASHVVRDSEWSSVGQTQRWVDRKTDREGGGKELLLV